MAIVVLAWVTAVLVVSPLLAAQSCLECCSHRYQSSLTKPACQHCPVNTPTANTGDSCHGCPKCETSRPSPATPVTPVESWQPSDLFVDLVWPTPTTLVTLVSPNRSSDALMVRLAHPPLQILYCTWLN